MNVQKCKYIIFHTPTKHVNSSHLAIDGAVIDRVLNFQFLGLTLDVNPNWNCHINQISNNISKSIGILNKLKHFIPVKTKVLLYNSLIVSHLNFCILAWGYQCDRVIKLQKKVIQILNLSKYNAHTEPILKELKLLIKSKIFSNCKNWNFTSIIITGNYTIICKDYLFRQILIFMIMKQEYNTIFMN